jgi:hypothetical protein
LSGITNGKASLASTYTAVLARVGGNYLIPLLLVAAAMLEAGYILGKKQAEVEMLEGWFKL